MCKDVSHGTRQKRGSACLKRVCVYRRFAWQAWGIVAARARRWIEGWRVARQAWDPGCMWAFGRTLGGGFAWQVW